MISNKPLRDVVNKEIEWLWQPMIPFGKVTMIQGDTNIGKTNIIIKIMADISNGVYPPTLYKGHLYEREKGEPLKIYYVSIENGIDDTVTPFFDVFGGNRDYVEYQDEKQGHFSLNGDEIRECVRLTGAKVIVVDPWQQFLDGISSTDNEGVRDMLTEVQRAAEDTGTAIILAGNYTKRGGNDIQKGIGASEMFNTLRSILTVKKAPFDDSDNIPSIPIRIIEASKMSFKGKEITPIAVQQADDYSLEFKDYVDLMDGVDSGLGRIVEGRFERPLGTEDEKKAAYVPVSLKKAESKADKAIELLKGMLADGPMDSNEVKRRTKEAGISMATINRVKAKAGVLSKQQPDKSSLWRLN